MHQRMARRRSGITALFAINLRAFVLFGTLFGLHSTRIILAAEQHPFTVKDSIEISYFVRPVLWTVNQDPPTEPMTSPDGQHLLVVTQRGILATNQVESSIWTFAGRELEDLVAGRSSKRPGPKKIASLAASSNTPVITDVRWLSDSRRVAFLGRTGNGTSQLFTVDVLTCATRQITRSRQSVTAYDIEGSKTVYTTLDEPEGTLQAQPDFIDVTGKNIFTLLWSKEPNRDRDESLLVTVPNTLHVVERGRELKLNLRFENKPLKLFFPILSLSPNGRFLITIAPVTNIPPKWSQYQPRFGYEDLRLDPGNKWATAHENAWKPSQFVKIDLAAGSVTSLIDAPAGRSLFHIFAPTKAMWSPDSLHVLLSDTFLPLTDQDNEESESRRTAPAAVTLEVAGPGDVNVVSYFPQPARGSSPTRHVSDLVWNVAKNEITLILWEQKVKRLCVLWPNREIVST